MSGRKFNVNVQKYLLTELYSLWNESWKTALSKGTKVVLSRSSKLKKTCRKRKKAEGTCSPYKFETMADFRMCLCMGQEQAAPSFLYSSAQTHPGLEHNLGLDFPKPEEVNGVSVVLFQIFRSYCMSLEIPLKFPVQTPKCNTNSTRLMKSIRLRLEVAPSQT